MKKKGNIGQQGRTERRACVAMEERYIRYRKTSRPCQQVATNLSISSVKIRLVAIGNLQTCYNLLKQLAASLWITSSDNQLATSLLTTCDRRVINKLSQAMRTHPDIGLLITSLLQDSTCRLAANCSCLAVYLKCL